MVKCLQNYKWLKCNRDTDFPTNDGLMGYYIRLLSAAAYRDGIGEYCHYINPVEKGSWVGGIASLKYALGVRSRKKALDVISSLAKYGYITFQVDKGKVITYTIVDWIVHDDEDTAAEQSKYQSAYCTRGFGFLCLKRDITERLVEDDEYVFGEADAWVDLWCHTVYNDNANVFSKVAPVIMYHNKPIITLDYLAARWKWSKAKVCRFLKKHSDTYLLCRLPSSVGSVIINTQYPVKFDMPSESVITKVYHALLRLNSGVNTHKHQSANDWANYLTLMCSRYVDTNAYKDNNKAYSGSDNTCKENESDSVSVDIAEKIKHRVERVLTFTSIFIKETPRFYLYKPPDTS